MKKLICILLFLSFLSCHKSNDDLIKDAIKTYMAKIVNDQNSYEFISYSVIDTIRLLDEATIELQQDKISIQDYQKFKDSLLTGKIHNDIYSIKILHTFRGTNGFGAKVINRIYLEMLPTILNDEYAVFKHYNTDEVITNPNKIKF